jgi:hypothetical protein
MTPPIVLDNTILTNFALVNRADWVMMPGQRRRHWASTKQAWRVVCCCQLSGQH